MQVVPTFPSLDATTYARIRRLVVEAVGIELGPNKQSLVESRLTRRLRALELPDYGAYLRLLAGPQGEQELVLLLDAISTNVTHFFREPEGLHLIAERHAGMVRAGHKRLRYWSAACSSGEEPYSLAMLLAEAAPLAGLDLAILATDISTRVLGLGKQGCYGQQAMRSVPDNLRARYGTTEGELWQVRPELRQLITFNRLNLIKPPWPMRGPFDAILIRNVMIYFDQTTRDTLIARLRDLLRPGGLLVTGQAESLSGRMQGLRMLRPSVYEKH